jgi:hypothetical protein
MDPRSTNDQAEVNRRLRLALIGYRRICGEAAQAIRRDHLDKALDILEALAGLKRGYRADIDAIHAIQRPEAS